MSPLRSPARHLTQSWRSEYLSSLVDWFQHHQRDLPWRRTRDPYAIWISESMLQQTQVATVIDYFERFMRRFPSVTKLASAAESDVMAQWAGLGYYRRARQLHAAAKRIAAEHAGVFPRDLEAIMDLPGIGRYTAGAIASIALGLPAPIVEANTERLYARLLKIEKPVREPEVSRQLWQFAQWQLEGKSAPNKSSEKHDPGIVNQAVMELGALICKPVEPQCLVCPIVKLCPTARHGLQARIPPPKPKRTFTQLHHVALIVQHRGRVLLRLNPPGGWWHGLWDFPRVDVTELALSRSDISETRLPWDEPTCARILQLAHQQLFAGSTTSGFTRLGDLLVSHSHGVTRYRIAVDGLATEVNRSHFRDRAQFQWVDAKSVVELPLTASAKKMLGKVAVK